MSSSAAALQEKLTESRKLMNEVVAKIGPDGWDKTLADPDHWSARDLVAHLLSAERGLRGRINRILAGDKTRPPGDFDLNLWNQRQVTKLRQRSVAELIDKLETERQTTYQVLARIASSELDRPGFRASGQPTTVGGLFELIADHESRHADELAAAGGV